MFYLKLLGFALAVPLIILFTVALFVHDFNLLDKTDRVGYSIMSVIVTAIVCLMVAAADADGKKKNNDDGYPP